MIPKFMFDEIEARSNRFDFVNKAPGPASMWLDSIRDKIKDNQKQPKNRKVYSAKELKEMPIGTVFIHNTLGKCMITFNEEIGTKQMIFRGRKDPVFFVNDLFPWTEPMEKISN